MLNGTFSSHEAITFSNAVAIFCVATMGWSLSVWADDCPSSQWFLKEYLSKCSTQDQCKDEQEIRQHMLRVCGPDASSSEMEVPGQPVDTPTARPAAADNPVTIPQHPIHRVADCDVLQKVRDNELAQLWDDAVRGHTAFRRALELNQQVLAEGLDRLGTLDVATATVLPLKFINDHVQMIAELSCVVLDEQKRTTACQIQELGSKTQDLVQAYYEANNLQDASKILVKKYAEEQSKKRGIGKVLVPLAKYTEENIKTGLLAQNYQEIKRTLLDQLQQTQIRIAEADRQLARMQTRKDAVARLRDWINRRCSNSTILLRKP